MASSRWSPCDVHGYVGQLGVHTLALRMTALPRGSVLPAKKGTSITLQLAEWRSQSQDFPVTAGRAPRVHLSLASRAGGVRPWGGPTGHSGPGPQRGPGSTHRRLSGPDLPPGPTRLGGPATAQMLSSITVWALAPCHLSLEWRPRGPGLPGPRYPQNLAQGLGQITGSQ